MKKKYLISGLTALALVAGSAGATSALAASSGSSSNHGIRGQKPAELTETQKTEMQAKFKAVQTALDSGDYSAWVTAEKALDSNSPLLSKITSSNFSDYVTQNKEREAKMEERQAQEKAVQAAVTAGDYSAWATAEKALDSNSPLLSKITSDNFSQYVQAQNLRTQADGIMKSLGLNGDEGQHMGGDFGPGQGGRGFGHAPQKEATSTDAE